MTEGEMVAWHHRLSGHKFEQTRGDGAVCRAAIRGVTKSRI